MSKCMEVGSGSPLGMESVSRQTETASREHGTCTLRATQTADEEGKMRGG